MLVMSIGVAGSYDPARTEASVEGVAVAPEPSPVWSPVIECMLSAGRTLILADFDMRLLKAGQPLQPSAPPVPLQCPPPGQVPDAVWSAVTNVAPGTADINWDADCGEVDITSAFFRDREPLLLLPAAFVLGGRFR